jgi:uncharacterized protein DUF2490
MKTSGARLKKAAAPAFTRWILLAVMLVCAVLGRTARAADSYEFWPETALYYGLRPGMRMYVDTAYASGPESDIQSLDLVLALDLSIKPLLREVDDWQRSQYFWMRAGYTRSGRAEDLERQTPEDRLFVQFSGKFELPGGIWIDGRARVDLRWINDSFSERYRLRAEVNREFKLYGHSVVPYFNVEWFYDTRYDGWSRKLYQLGSEFTVNTHFRYEIYVARQNDYLPTETNVAALGLMGKWYY